MTTVSPPFVLYFPTQFDYNCFTKAHEYVACNNKKERQQHSLHVRIPVILNSYLGSPCLVCLICKGFITEQ